MFALILGGHGLLALGKLPKGCKTNSQYFSDVVLEVAKRSVTAITGKSGIEGTMVSMGSSQVHDSTRITQRLGEFQVIRLAHPPSSPGISPCDFWLFGWSKHMMKGHQFQSVNDVQAFLVDL
jgi:hypothetical protein